MRNKKIVISLGVVLVLAALVGGGWYWIGSSLKITKKQESNPAISSQEGSRKVSLGKCHLNSREISLRTTEKYNIFGEDIFDVAVCGYMEVKEEKMFGNYQKNVYLKIVEFDDRNFEAALKSEIEKGNAINFEKDGYLYFNLGCLENGKISAQQYGENPYLDEKTETKILNSSADNMVAVVLSFGIHPGKGCLCCNLAHEIRIIE